MVDVTNDILDHPCDDLDSKMITMYQATYKKRCMQTSLIRIYAFRCTKHVILIIIDAYRSLVLNAYALRTDGPKFIFDFGLGVFVHVTVIVAWHYQHRRNLSGEL